MGERIELLRHKRNRLWAKYGNIDLAISAEIEGETMDKVGKVWHHGLLRNIAEVPGPLLSKPEYGREPSLLEMITEFYSRRDMENPKELAADYIAKHGR